MTTPTKKTGLDLLREPFPDNQVSILCRSTKKDNPKGRCNKCGGYHGLPAVALSYIGHASITDRLLDADPSWTWEPLAIGPDGNPVIDRDGGLWIKLTVCGVTRLGYGDAPNKTGGDAMKERIGDALRNAAMRFGAGLHLWHKGDLHAHQDDDALPEPPNPTMDAAELNAMLDAIKLAANQKTLKQLYENAETRAIAIGDSGAIDQIRAMASARQTQLKAAATGAIV